MAITMCGQDCKTRDGYQACSDPQVSFTGCVLGTYECNGYDDSDFYAIVWDGERVTTREYASTRGWTYHNHADIDATPETLAKATEYARDKYLQRAARKHAESLSGIKKGRQARSLTTKGKAKGVVGTIAWVGPNQYASRWAVGDAKLTVGIRPEGMPNGKNLVFVAGDKVEVTPDVEPFDRAQAEHNADAWTARDPWRSLVDASFYL